MQPKLFFMSRPTTKATDRRTWLFREGEQGKSYLVRVYPTGNGTRFVCDCKVEILDIVRAPKYRTGCSHIKAARSADFERFDGVKTNGK